MTHRTPPVLTGNRGYRRGYRPHLGRPWTVGEVVGATVAMVLIGLAIFYLVTM